MLVQKRKQMLLQKKKKKADADNNEIKIKFGVLTSHLHKRPKLPALLTVTELQF